MLVIRQEQLAALSDAMIESFLTRLITPLREAFASHGLHLSQEEVAGERDAGIHAAQDAGFDEISDIGHFVLILARYYRGKWDEALPDRANLILRAEGVDSRERLKNFEEWSVLQLSGQQ